jgi:hypothetical protein
MKGWRTLALNSALAVFGVLEAADWTSVLGNDSAGWVVAGIAAANLILRTVTNTEVGKRT